MKKCAIYKTIISDTRHRNNFASGKDKLPYSKRERSDKERTLTEKAYRPKEGKDINIGLMHYAYGQIFRLRSLASL